LCTLEEGSGAEGTATNLKRSVKLEESSVGEAVYNVKVIFTLTGESLM